jgi:superfamily II DNA or RNA helicase
MEFPRPPFQDGTIPIGPDLSGGPGLGQPEIHEISGSTGLNGNAVDLRTSSLGVSGGGIDITAPQDRGRDAGDGRHVPETANSGVGAERAEPAVADTPAAGGGGDVPNTPGGGEIPTPGEDPEYRGACFGSDVLKKVVGIGEAPPRQLDKDGAEIYDERRQIVDDARQAIKAMRDNHKTVAESVGMEVTEKDIEDWKPDVAGLAKLQKDLAPMRRRAHMVNGAEAYVEDQVAEAADAGIRLRPHQQDVAEGYRDFLRCGERNERGGKSGLVVQPTGTGKTRELVETVAMVRHMEDPKDPSTILVLTPTKKIQEQTVGADGEKGFGKFMPDEDVGRYDEDTPQAERDAVLQKRTIVMCMPSFLRLVEAGKMPHVDKIIVDEAHRMVGEKSAETLTRYGADKIMVGFTATPDYNKIRSARTLFTHKIAEMELPEAANRGLVAPIRGYLIKAEPVIKGKLPDDPIERKIALREAQMEGRIRAAIEIVKKELERGYADMQPYCDREGIENRGIGVVIRCKPGDNVGNAYEFAKRFRGMYVHGPNGPQDLRQIMPAFVGGDSKRQTQAVRDEVMDAYTARKINLMANDKYLEIGWDDEFPKVWIDLSGGNEVDTKQGLGREVRLMRDKNGDPILGPDGRPIEAHAYSFVDPERDGRYSVLDALGGTKSGQLIEFKPGTDAPIPRRRVFSEGRPANGNVKVRVEDVVATTVGSISLEGQVDVPTAASDVPPQPEAVPYVPPVNPLAPSGWPNQSGLGEFAETFPGERMPQMEAARLLGVHSPTLKGMMNNQFGDPDYTPTAAEIKQMLVNNPTLQAPPRPEAGFTEIPPRDLNIRYFARGQGIPLQRFTDIDGMVKFYLRDDDLIRLAQLAETQGRNGPGQGRRPR